MKKTTAIVLIACMMMVVFAALAAVPSKTTQDLTSITQTVSASGAQVTTLINVLNTATEAADAQLAEIAAYVGQNHPVLNYFTQDVQTAVQGLLPANVDPANLVMNEFVDLQIGDYQESDGAISSTFSFATVFGPEQTVIALIGYFDTNGAVVWTALPVTNTNGMLQITFSKELMILMGHHAILSILSI